MGVGSIMAILSYSQVDDDAGPESFYFSGKVYRSFYANERWWIFYVENTSPYNLVYRTSTNGTSWSNETIFRVGTASGYQLLAIWFDGIYLHYAFHQRTTGYGTPIYYRMGTPESNGTITWLAAEQTAIAGIASKHYRYLTIVCDSNGYPWIGCYRYSSSAGDRKVYVHKSSTKNGTWIDANGFPYCPDNNDEVRSRLYLAPLSSAQMYILYDKGATGGVSYPINGRLWTGSWGDQETIINNSNDQASAIGYGSKVHLVYRDGLTNDYKYIVRDGTWGTPILIETNNEFDKFSLSVNNINGKLYLFYIEGNPTDGDVVKYRIYSSSWSDAVILQDRKPKVLIGCFAFYEVLNQKIGVFWNDDNYGSNPYILGYSGLTGITVFGNGYNGGIIPSSGDSIGFERILDISIEQSCDVALRNVPLKSTGEIMDTGTYLLHTLTLEFTTRLSDDEKTTIETIFTSHDKVDVYLGEWMFTGWLRKPDIVYEYESNRPWRARLIFDIYTYNYFGSSIGTFSNQQLRLIGGTTLDYENIIDFIISQETSVSIPQWVNQDPSIDTNVWNKLLKRMTYTVRETEYRFYQLLQILTAHTAITLYDYIHGPTNKTAWLISVRAVWNPLKKFDYPSLSFINTPWEVEFEIIVQE